MREAKGRPQPQGRGEARRHPAVPALPPFPLTSGTVVRTKEAGDEGAVAARGLTAPWPKRCRKAEVLGERGDQVLPPPCTPATGSG